MQDPRNTGLIRSASVVAVVLAGLFTAGTAHALEIAGLNPSVRPAGAPVLTVYPKDDAWYAAALRGVEQPYPESLRFLENQGAWFTPFIHPGMLGPYDIRGWHAGGQN